MFVSSLSASRGRVVGASKILRDDNKRAIAEEKLRLVAEFAPSAMVVIDQEGRITLINASAEKLFGYHRSELLGQPGGVAGAGTLPQ
jgi:PAS domain-containing protein